MCILAGFISGCQESPPTASPSLLPSSTVASPSPSPSASNTALLRPTSSFTITFGVEYGLAPSNIQRTVHADTDCQHNDDTGANTNTYPSIAVRTRHGGLPAYGNL